MQCNIVALQDLTPFTFTKEMKKLLMFFVIILSFLYLFYINIFVSDVLAGEISMLLSVKPVADDFFKNAREGSDPKLANADDMIMVVGIINTPSFAVKNINNIALYDGTDNIIPIIADKSSFYSEFDDDEINFLRIAFIVKKEQIARQSTRLVWGDNINSKNKVAEEIPIYTGNRGVYMTFSLEEKPEEDSSTDYTATVDVIVDDYADIYYIWYLLPMALILGLLFLKKILLK